MWIRRGCCARNGGDGVGLEWIKAMIVIGRHVGIVGKAIGTWGVCMRSGSHRGKRYCMYDAHTINCILRAHKGRKIVMARDGRVGCSTLQSLLRNPDCAFCSGLDGEAGVAVCAHGVVHR